LPQPVAPHGTVDLDIGYEGVIVLDATRLERIGAPQSTARSSDWDQIGEGFTALRGVGYVAWYPIATDVVNFSEESTLFDVLARWKSRAVVTKSHLGIEFSIEPFSSVGKNLPAIFFNGVPCQIRSLERYEANADCAVQPSRLDTPTIVIADYKVLERQYVE